jgi:hypothetical protein
MPNFLSSRRTSPVVFHGTEKRDGNIVGVGTVMSISSNDTSTSYQAIVQLDATALREYAAACCRFLKYDGRSKNRCRPCRPNI